MSTTQILEKAAALKAQEEEEKKETKRGGRQQTSGWVDVETFEDKASGVGIVITGRDSGPQRYSIQFVGLESNRANKFISLPRKGATRPLKEVVYLLVEKAEAFIEEEKAKARKARGDRPRNDRKKDGKKGDRRKDRNQPQGLSALAQKDSQKGDKSEKYVGKTEKKKAKKSGKNEGEKS